MTNVAFPFLTLSEEAVDSTPWEVLHDGTSITQISYLKDWDYLGVIRVRRSLRIIPDIAANDLGIPVSELKSIKITLRIGTGPGNKPRQWVEAVDIPINTSGENIYIDHEIPGDYLSTRLQLNTVLVIDTPPQHSSPLTPTLKGSRVWNDQIDISLEGEEPRFPVETISFTNQPQFAGRPLAGAPWYLHWNPTRIHDEFAGAVRLFLNSDNEAFIERFKSSDELTLQTVMADVMTQMVVSVLTQTDLHESLPGCEPGSVGYMISFWMETAFPGSSISAINSTLASKPSDFHASLLAAAEL